MRCRGRLPALPAWFLVCVLLDGFRALAVAAALQGTVTDPAGAGLGNVRISVFIDGVLQTSALSDSNGAYIVDVALEENADRTVVVWWIPSRADQVPELALLRESAASKDLRLWNPCWPRLDLRTGTVHDVVIRRREDKLRSLTESDCLQERK